MIGKIKGVLVSVDHHEGLIETASGLSYKVFLTNQILSTTSIGDSIDVITHLQVREDALILFGFVDVQEYTLFQLLLGVSGVGPKTAFSVISATRPSELIESVKSQDASYLTKIPGLGKKTALKILLELSQKFKTEFKLEDTALSKEDATVVDALAALGFKKQDARDILHTIEASLSTEEKITLAIRALSK